MSQNKKALLLFKAVVFFFALLIVASFTIAPPVSAQQQLPYVPIPPPSSPQPPQPSPQPTPQVQQKLKQKITTDNVIDRVHQAFMQNVRQWSAAIVPLAWEIFWALVLIDFVLSIGTMIIESGELGGIFAAMVRKVLYISFCVWVLSNPVALMDSIIQGFRDVAGIATGNPGGGLAVADFLDTAIKKGSVVLKNAAPNLGDFFKAASAVVNFIVTFFLILIYWLCVIFIAAYALVVIIESHILISGGVIMLAFLGASYTKNWGLQYISYAVKVGMKLLVLTLIFGLLTNFLDSAVFQAAGNNVWTDALAMMVIGVISVLLTWMLPSVASNFITGVAGAGASAMVSKIKGSAMAGGGVAKAAAMGAVTGGVGTAAALGSAGKLAATQMAKSSSGGAAGAAGAGGALDPLRGMGGGDSGGDSGVSSGGIPPGAADIPMLSGGGGMTTVGKFAAKTGANFIYAGGKDAWNRLAGTMPNTGRNMGFRMAQQLGMKNEEVKAAGRKQPAVIPKPTKVI